MKYFIDYQYLSRGASRPVDDGEVVPIEIGAGADPSVLPNVTDLRVEGGWSLGEEVGAAALLGRARLGRSRRCRASRVEV